MRNASGSGKGDGNCKPEVEEYVIHQIQEFRAKFHQQSLCEIQFFLFFYFRHSRFSFLHELWKTLLIICLGQNRLEYFQSKQNLNRASRGPLPRSFRQGLIDSYSQKGCIGGSAEKSAPTAAGHSDTSSITRQNDQQQIIRSTLRNNAANHSVPVRARSHEPFVEFKNSSTTLETTARM